MSISRQVLPGEKVLIEAEVVSPRVNAEGGDLSVSYYRVRVPGYRNIVTVIADVMHEKHRPNFKLTDTDFEGDRSVVAKKIRQYRQAANLSQQGLSEVIGVKQNTISLWELGRTIPRFYHGQKLASALGVDVNDIYGENE